MRTAVKALLDNGFYLSAKHEFQLFKNICVLGQEFVFSVDLMHPSERENPQMYLDVIDMGIPDRYDPRETRFVKPIAFDSSDIIFSHACWSDRIVSGTNLKI